MTEKYMACIEAAKVASESGDGSKAELKKCGL